MVPELVVAGILHLLLAFHIGTARSRASHQRQQDLDRFEALKNPTGRVNDSTDGA